MKVAIDGRTLETEHRLRGIGAYSAELLKALAEIDRENEYVFLTQQSPSAASQLDLGSSFTHRDELIRRGADPTRYSWYVDQLTLPAAIRRSGADIVHILEQLNVPWVRPVPTVVTVHDLIQISSLSPSTWKYRIKLAAAVRAERIIAISEAVKQDLIDVLHINPAKIRVVYNGHNQAVRQPPTPAEIKQLPTVRKRLLGDRDAAYLLYVGSYRALEPRKNLDFLLRMFQRFVAESGREELFLVMVGITGQESERLLASISSKIRSRVKFVGHVAHEALAPYYHAAAALVFPSLLEGFGLPPLEAMACGTPVLSSNTTSLPEVVGDGGYLLDPTDEAAWCAALTEVLSGSKATQSMIDRGLKQAAKFSWKKCAKETLAVYQELAN